MQIFIKIPNEDPCEWAIIELQGSLEPKDKNLNPSIDPNFIGDLHFTKKGIPIFIIGHHILQGKEVKLEKPIAVLEKLSNENITTDNSTEEKHTEYSIKAMIKRKIQFNIRPKPIIGNAKKIT